MKRRPRAPNAAPRSGVFAVLVALLVPACAPQPVAYPDWLIEIPDGTAVHEYAPVPVDRRDPDAIKLVDELVIGANLENPDRGVFRPRHVVGTADGTVFVADAATKQVQMYDASGAFVRTLGREGQGPGEFESLSAMTIADDRLVVDDRRNGRYSTWSLRGEHLQDYVKISSLARGGTDVWGLPDGTVVVQSRVFSGDEQLGVVTRLSLGGDELARLDEFHAEPGIVPENSWTPADYATAFLELFARPRRFLAVASNAVYVTPLHEYQIFTWAPDGAMTWALRVAQPRPDYSAWAKNYIAWRINGPDIEFNVEAFDWPESRAWAIDAILTDGAGRLYVLPGASFDAEPPENVPVDVYSPLGERLAAGYLPARWNQINAGPSGPWSHAAGEYVYGIREDEMGETVAVRYRLLLTLDGEE